jgi:hypothetical protein
LTVGGGGGLTGPGGGQTAGYTGAGGLIGHPWRSDREHLFQSPKNLFLQTRFFKDFNRFKFRDHSEIFMDQVEERWCSLEIFWTTFL